MLFASVLVIIVNLLNLSIISWLRQRNSLNQFAARKILHITSALGVIWAASILSQQAYILICLLFAVVYGMLKRRNSLKGFEVAHGTNYGEPLFPLGLAAMGALLWSNPQQHIIGILILGLCDTFGAFLQEYGTHPFGISARNTKRIGYFLLTLVLLLFGFQPVTALAIAVLLTIVEDRSPYGTDNLSVPVAYSVAILFLNLMQSS